MAIDPQISLGYVPPQINLQAYDPLARVQRMLTIQSLMDEGQLRKMQIEQMRTAIQEGYTLADLWKTKPPAASTVPAVPATPAVPPAPAVQPTPPAFNPVPQPEIAGVPPNAFWMPDTAPAAVPPAAPAPAAPALIVSPAPSLRRAPIVSPSPIVSPAPNVSPAPTVSPAPAITRPRYPTTAQILQAAPQTGWGYAQKVNEMQKSDLALQEQMIKTRKEAAARLGSLAGTAKDVPSATTAILKATSEGLFDQDPARNADIGRQLLDHLRTNGFNQQEFADFAREAMTAAEQHTAQLADLKNTRDALKEGWDNASRTIGFVGTAADWPAWWKLQDKVIRDYLPPTMTDAQLPQWKAQIKGAGVSPDVLAREGQPQGEFERTWLPAFAKRLKKTVDQLTPEENIQAYREFKQDPVQQELANTQKLLAIVQARMQLNQMPTQEQAQQVATDLIHHRMAPEQMSQIFGGFGAQGQAFKRMVYVEAKKMEPEFDFEQAAAEYLLTKNIGFQNTVRYMDSVVESLPQLIDRSRKLSNLGIRSINDLVNRVKDEFNGISLKRYNTDRLLLADEVAKILQGGGTGAGTSDAKLRQAEQIFRSNDDPSAIEAAAEEVTQLIGNRRRALTRGTSYENTGPAVLRPDLEGAKKSLESKGPGRYKLTDGNWYRKNKDGSVEVMIAPPQ